MVLEVNILIMAMEILTQTNQKYIVLIVKIEKVLVQIPSHRLEKVRKAMDKVHFVGVLFSTRKDQDGEVKVTFVVPKMHQNIAMNLPEETSFSISVEQEVA